MVRLEYEAYEPMALKEMDLILSEALQRWPRVRRVACAHRLGVVPLAEASVLIVVSSEHRAEAWVR